MKLKKNIAVIMAAVILLAGFAPVLHAAWTQAQTKAYWNDVCGTAKKDAEKEINNGLWFLAGCLVGIIGVLVAYVAAPSVPPERLIGKRSDYVLQYTYCYTQRTKDLQTGNAWTGFGTYCGVVLLIYAIVGIVALTQPH
jgi:hypothetical protein